MDHRPKGKTQNYVTYTRGENLGDHGFGNEFLDTIPKAWPMKEKIGMLGFIKTKKKKKIQKKKLKKFCSVKELRE